MDCGQCSTANRDDALFCAGCGAKLISVCASCDRELAPEARFCDRCGTPVADARETSTHSTSAADGDGGAARKTVTVLFADLAGSTGFGERVDPESARVVMARYHAMLQAVVDDHRGTVAKFIGDGMMATFGIPEIAEDDAARAVAAGADMQRRFDELAADVEHQYGDQLALRVGVNTGEVVIGDADADIVGDALNVAARLEAACELGRVLVGEETWRLTRDGWVYEAVGEVAVKGRAEPVVAHALVDESADEVAATPFVGRGAELSRLRTVFDDAMATRSGRFVTVMGSPGVGKTRLAQEFERALGTDVSVYTTACDQTGEAALGPIVQLIRPAGSMGDGAADVDTARDALATALPAELDDRDRLVDGLARLAGLAPAQSAEETFWTVRRLVEVIGSDAPIVAVIDDIQWGESLLLDLLEHVVESVRDTPFLVIGLARPELRERRPSLCEPGRRVADVVRLDGLDADATAELAARMLDADRLPDELLERLPTSTEGNPLFVRELVRMLVDDGVLAEEDGQWVLTIDVDGLDVPPTIQSLLATRIERLSPEDRTLLERAAVIGPEFSLSCLREVLDEPARPGMDVVLERLRRMDLVEPTGAYWGDHVLYRFHHVLIRDAVYRRLLKAVRADRHEQVARWLEEASATIVGEHEALIAHHYEAAFECRRQLGTIDHAAIDLGRRAGALLHTAANQALAKDDAASAGSLGTRALRLLPEHADERSNLLLTTCEALLVSGDTDSVPSLVDELAIGDEIRRSWADCYAAQLINATDPTRLHEAEKLTTAAAERFTDVDDPTGEAKAHQVRASVMARLGRVGECEAELDLALAAARRADDRRRIVAVLGVAPVAALWGPSPVARAGGRCVDVVRLLRVTSASPAVEAISTRCQATLEALRGKFARARSLLERARATVDELGSRRDRAETDLLAGFIEMLADDHATSVTHLRNAHDGLDALGVGADAGYAAALLARSLFHLDRLDEATSFALRSEELAGDNLKTAIAWRSVQAELAASRGELDDAVALATAAVEIASSTDLILDHAEACAALARVHRRSGDAVRSRDVAADARRIYTDKGVAAAVIDRLLGVDSVANGGGAGDAKSAAGQMPGRPLFEDNRATANVRARWAWMAAPTADDADYLDLVADHCTVDDRRRLGGGQYGGPPRLVAIARSIADSLGGKTTVDVEPIAQRGGDITLTRIRMSSAFENVFLVLTQVDDEGACRECGFDLDDLLDAVIELERWWGESGEEGVADTAASEIERHRARRDRDFDALAAQLAPTFVGTDHRAGGFGTVDRAGWLERERSGIDLLTDHVVVSRTEMSPDPPFIGEYVTIGTTKDGVDIEIAQVVVGHADESGSVTRLDTFDPEDVDAARALFEQLAARSSTGRRSLAAPSKAVEAFVANVERLRAGDIDGHRAHITDDFEQIDRRRTVGGGRTYTADEHVEELRGLIGAMQSMGAELRLDSILAQRGDNIVLARQIVVADEVLATLIVLSMIDDEGRERRVAVYDPEDLADAAIEMEEWYLEIDLEARESWARVRQSSVRTSIAGGSMGGEAKIAADFRAFDHRSIGFGEIDAEGWAERDRSRSEAFERHVNVYRHERAAWPVLFFESLHIGTTAEGTPVEYSQWCVLTMDDDGRLEEMHIFEAGSEGLAAAESLFWELADTTATTTGDDVWFGEENLAVEHWRRSGLETVNRVIAQRGERIALLAVGDPESLVLLEIGVVGGADIIRFDWSELAVANVELHRRALRDHEDPDSAAWLSRQLLEMAEEYVKPDGEPDLVRMSPDLRVVDHRSISFGDTAMDGWVARSRSRRHALPDAAALSRFTDLEGRTILHRWLVRGRTSDGITIEYEQYLLATLGADDLIERLEFFDTHDEARARARFAEMVREDAERLPVFLDENWAMKQIRRLVDRARCGDVEALAGVIHDGEVADPATLRVAGFVAQRGTTVALARLRVGDDESSDFLVLVEGDDSMTRFPATDLVEALVATEEAWRPVSDDDPGIDGRLAQLRHRSTKDFGGLESIYAPEFEARDHRTISFGDGDRGAWMDRERSRAEVLEQDLVHIRSFHSGDGPPWISEIVSTGTTADGVSLEKVQLLVGRSDTDGTITDVDIYDRSQVADAWDRFLGLRSR